MDAPLCDGPQSVKVGILLTAADTDGVVISPGGCGMDYKPAENQEPKAFSFDGVATVDHMQSFNSQLLQPLIESVCRGFKGALLLCGASTPKIHNLVDACVIKQVLTEVFDRVVSQVKDGWFTSVSFLQFSPDGGAVDLLHPHRQTLKHVTHPILGSLVEGSSEVCVSSAEEALALHEMGRKTLQADTGSVYRCCSSMFSLSVEWKLHPEEVESEVFRSRLQLFSLAGAAGRADLSGVNPLVKVVDQSQHEATSSQHLLHFLLNEALTGNCRTVVIFFIHPPALLLSDEIASALALAQKVRGFITTATADVWYPRATEQDIRDKITQVRTQMMSQRGKEVRSIHRLAELTQNLQMVKKQSWEKRREMSKKIKETDSKTPMRDSSNHNDSTETIECLQDHLRREMEEHIREGRGAAENVEGRVGRIQQLMEALREERVKMEAAAEKADICQHSQQEYSQVLEQRRKLREDSRRLIQEEVERMERDLAQTEGPHRELLVLSRERRVLVLQMEALRAEAQQAERDLQNQHLRHQTELQCLRDESLQVFQVFYRLSEEQRKMSEDRYRNILMEAVQDAVYLSAQNQQLQADNKQLHKVLAEMKDSIAARGEANAEHSTQHGPT